MGFRSTFTTEHYGIKWPDWFVEKWQKAIHFPDGHSGAISSKHEAKTYGLWEDLPDDLQKAIPWDDFGLKEFVMVYLHECGGITRCQIERNAIKWSEPEEWRITEGVTHNYCYGCSRA